MWQADEGRRVSVAAPRHEGMLAGIWWGCNRHGIAQRSNEREGAGGTPKAVRRARSGTGNAGSAYRETNRPKPCHAQTVHARHAASLRASAAVARRQNAENGSTGRPGNTMSSKTVSQENAYQFTEARRRQLPGRRSRNHAVHRYATPAVHKHHGSTSNQRHATGTKPRGNGNAATRRHHGTSTAAHAYRRLERRRQTVHVTGTYR